MSAKHTHTWRLGMGRMVMIGFALTGATTAVSSVQSRPPVRRGAPQGPPTDVTVSIGGSEYAARVDARCRVDEKATASNTRAYFMVMYPWFGQRPPADQPQWRVNLEIRRSASPEGYDQFNFSFVDGARSATIQTVAGSPRMGSGSVRVTRHDMGARFQVEGRSNEGEPVRAVIDCPRFQPTEGEGG